MNKNARVARLRVVIASSLIVGAAGFASVSPARAVTLYSAPLSGDQVVPGPGDSDAVGSVWDLELAIDPDVPNGGRICVGWEITDMDPATSAEIGIGAPGESGATVVAVTPPDEEGTGFDCVQDLDPAIVQAILDNPTAYFLQVRDDAFPDGAMRGQIQVSQTVRVTVRTLVCPGSIRTVADALAAPDGTCANASRTGDFGLPAGHTWTSKPIEFDMRIQLETDGQVLTLNDADLEGGFTCGPKTCTPPFSTFSWNELAPGPITLTALTAPRGYRFGWATIVPASEGEAAPTGTVNAANHSISFDMTDFGDTQGVLITVYDFRGH